MENINNIRAKLTMENTNYIVRDHRVHGVNIMPGVTILDSLYRILQSKGIDTRFVELKDVTFLKAVSTSDDYDQSIRINIEADSDYYNVVVDCQKIKNGIALSDEWERVLQCKLIFCSKFEQGNIDIAGIKSASDRVEDIDYAYSFVRRIDISHRDFMKGRGKLYFFEDHILAEITLGDLAAGYLDTYYMHPAYLDAATLVQGFVALQDVDQLKDVKASIPVYIKSFKAYDRMNDVIYVYIENKYDEGSIDKDIMYFDIHVYNEDGAEIATFRQWGLKKIRHKELVAENSTQKTKSRNLTNDKLLSSKSDTKERHIVDDSKDRIKEYLREILANMLETDIDSSMDLVGYYDCGLESTDILQIVGILEQKLGTELYPTLLFEYSNIQELSEYLYNEFRENFFAEASENSVSSDNTANTSETLLYTPSWSEMSPIQDVKKYRNGLIIAGIFDDVELIKQSLRCSNWIVVKNSEEYSIRENVFLLDFKNASHWQQLYTTFEDNKISLDLIVHIPNATAIREYCDYTCCLQEVFYNCKALLNAGFKQTLRYVIAVTPNKYENELIHSIFGFFNCISNESGKIDVNCIQIDEMNAKRITPIICEELKLRSTPLVLWSKNTRFEYNWSRHRGNMIRGKYIIPGEYYLVSGGLGGLGKLLIDEVLGSGGNVIILGRTSSKTISDEMLSKETDSIRYYSCDVSDADSVRSVKNSLEKENIGIRGVFHLAGIIKDNYVRTDTWDNFETVVSTKAKGAILLDEFFVDDNTDWFVCFSSVSGILGNPAQANYATANGFLDGYVVRRNRETESNKYISVNWPLWKHGGMESDQNTLNKMRNKYYIQPIDSSDALGALDLIINNSFEQTMVVYGDKANWENYLYRSEESDDKQHLTKSFYKKESIEISDKPKENLTDTEIAIIGMSGYFPMAESIDHFWDNLYSGRDCISQIPPQRWDSEQYKMLVKENMDKEMPLYGGLIEHYDKFDTIFFNISPSQANLMDPQERLFLEVAWECFTDAGYNKTTLQGAEVGVFVGAMWLQYQMLNTESEVSTSTISSIANRVSYYFGLVGPSIATDTMCSSSLTALHMACQSIESGDCNMALVGGTNLSVHPDKYRLLAQGNFASSNGRCNTFSENGDGYVPGEVVGSILLKSVNQAIEDGDNIYAIIRSSALNHGGNAGGFTVPNPKSQELVIKKAIERSGLSSESISYLEAHGTGTSLGDPIEINALKNSYVGSTRGRQHCSIGSVKTNIGHAESAAGIASIIKVLLQMKHNILVPTINWSPLNKSISWEDSPFYIQKETETWANKDKIAAISAFGAGGSNAHVILQKYDKNIGNPKIDDINPTLMVFSGQTEEQLFNFIDRVRSYYFDTSRSDRIESEVVCIISNILDVPVNSVFLSDSYTDLNLDENQKIRICDAINRSFGITVTPMLLDSQDTVSGTKKYIARCLNPKTSSIAAQDTIGDIAFTLSKRESLKYKLAIVVTGMDDFNKKLMQAVQKQFEHSNCIYTNIQSLKRNYAKNGDPQNDLAIDWIEGNFTKIKDYFSNIGSHVVHLPSYPFARRTCWMGHKEESQIAKTPKTYTSDTVTYQLISGNIAVVTISDPINNNVFTEDVILGLMYYFEEIKKNREIKAVILTGSSRVFCMGGTKNQLADISNSKLQFSDAPFLYRGLLECEVPIISAMQGHASGGGMLFGLYADIVIMSLEGVYSAVFTKYGFTPGMGATFILEEKLGKNLASEMMYSAKSYTGKELQARNASVIFKPQERVLEEAFSIAKMISEKPRNTLAVLKKELSGRVMDRLLICVRKEEEMHKETFRTEEVKNRISHYYITSEEMQGNSQATDDIEGTAHIKIETPNEESIESMLSLVYQDGVDIEDIVELLEGKYEQ